MVQLGGFLILVDVFAPLSPLKMMDSLENSILEELKNTNHKPDLVQKSNYKYSLRCKS